MTDPSLSNSMLMDLLNATQDSSPSTHRISSLACALPLSALTTFVPVLFGADASV